MRNEQIDKKVLLNPSVNFYSDDTGLNIEVETSRLLICSYRENDFENCVALYGDEVNTKLFDNGRARSRNEVLELVRGKGRTYFSKLEPFGLFSIFLKKNMDFIGQIDLVPDTEPGSVEIGFILHKKYQNQGLCSETVKAFIEVFVEELNHRENFFSKFPISKIMATTHPNNISSIAVLKKNGMSLEKKQNRFNQPRLYYSRIIRKTLINEKKND